MKKTVRRTKPIPKKSVKKHSKTKKRTKTKKALPYDVAGYSSRYLGFMKHS